MLNDVKPIEEIEQELVARFGSKLEPIRAPLKDRQRYARLAKLTEEPYKIKGNRQNADEFIRAKFQ
ncbi:hypothetical protein SAMN05660742_11196 [Propionispira arboris]|uniref:Uncharacterized protein n=1 Tax=Propionispira arboris TaxID=84035 RepID=A0A1H7ACX5_9FIRM|nr:hypothetical protein [Propionispira arboris]SEJ59922.1 hypothetical protein SAMN05660742_11196 [Propionispira arboris]